MVPQIAGANQIKSPIASKLLWAGLYLARGYRQATGAGKESASETCRQLSFAVYILVRHNQAEHEGCAYKMLHPGAIALRIICGTAQGALFRGRYACIAESMGLHPMPLGCGVPF